MPELPEVESVKLSLSQQIIGLKIININIYWSPIIVFPSQRKIKTPTKIIHHFKSLFTGQTVSSIERRAKNLIFTFSNKTTLLAHLKMTGQFLFYPDNNFIQDKHTHIIFSFSNDAILIYKDIRKFGYCVAFENKKFLLMHSSLTHLGLEPFSPKFTLNYLKNKLQQNQSPIKSVLLQQKVVVGCGNIYCDEVCFASKILPYKKANELTTNQIKLLHKNILFILKKAIDFNGTSLANYINSKGDKGNFLQFLKIYGKADQACPICQHKISKTTVLGRTTCYCSHCQN